jgi:hypothetical protein
MSTVLSQILQEEQVVIGAVTMRMVQGLLSESWGGQ